MAHKSVLKNVLIFALTLFMLAIVLYMMFYL